LILLVLTIRWPFQRSCSKCVDQSIFSARGLQTGGMQIVHLPQGDYIADSQGSSDGEDGRAYFDYAMGGNGVEADFENGGEGGEGGEHQARGPTRVRINFMGMNIDVVGEGVPVQGCDGQESGPHDEAYWHRYRQEQERRFAQQHSRMNEEQMRQMRRRMDDDIALRRRLQQEQTQRDMHQQSMNRMHQQQQQMHQQMHRNQQQHVQHQQNHHRQIHQQNHTRMVQQQQQQARVNHHRR
jgi:hypothetical protein